ncbi:hypothetical protein [Variovorax sp. W6]|uniref:hypothetical protein n=1 Tax=Variovorax sp. W6 TaxID=3093895 RepID=UPI003D8084CD
MVHNATITLKLPCDMDTGARVTALRAAGVPVDAEGNAQQGFLFVRSGDGYKSQVSIFRWFPDEVGPITRSTPSAPELPREHRPAPPPGDTLDHWLAQILTTPIPSTDTALQCEPDAQLTAATTAAAAG